MDQKIDWEKLIRRMELLMRLKSFPVGFKMLEKKEELDSVPFMRPNQGKVTLCQLITKVRNFDWTVGAVLDDFLSPVCPSMIGLTEIPEFGFKDGTFRSIVWVKTKEDGRKYENAIPRLPVGKYEAVAMGPMVYHPFDPDIILIYANPAQMMLLINALQFEDYEVMQFFCVGESSCADAIARCYLSEKPSLTIPCYGERRYGHAQDEDLVMAIPAGMMEKALKGMETLYRRGIRYPISFAGAEQDLGSAFPMSYGGMEQLKDLKGDDNRLLLGITGGIAGGKTAVANMLAELGAPIIDFDIISREVVEPDKQAWKQIVAFFGEQVLLEDRTLDRQTLSDIVFNDMVKRKKLESFIHPQIAVEFSRQVQEIAAGQPGAIIQVVVPLMIEVNLQYMMDKLVVVYVPEETQIKRLAKRDNITEAAAANILASQLSIEEKVTYADHVISNEGTLEETRRHVEKLWETLQQFQKDRLK